MIYVRRCDDHVTRNGEEECCHDHTFQWPFQGSWRLDCMVDEYMMMNEKGCVLRLVTCVWDVKEGFLAIGDPSLHFLSLLLLVHILVLSAF